MPRQRKTKTAIEHGWIDISKKLPPGIKRRFKYSKQKICQNCGQFIEPKKRFCNILCKDAFYDRLLERTKIIEVAK